MQRCLSPFVLSRFASAVIGLLLIPCLRAQVSHTATALGTMRCDAGQVVDVILAGTSLSPSNNLSASNGQVFASGSYRTTTTSTGLRYSLTESATGGFSGAASTGVHESLWVIQSAQPIAGVLTMSGTSTTPISTAATVQVDIGNDGSIEWSVASGAPMQIPVSLVSALSIRVRTQTISGFGTANFSVALNFTVTPAKEVFGAGCGAPLSLDSNSPALGRNWDLTTTNVDPTSPIVVTFFGARGPAVSFAQLGLSAPGCFSHLSSTVGSLVGNNVGNAATISIPIPNNSAFVGLRLASQSVCLTPSNAAGLLASNGLEGVVGN